MSKRKLYDLIRSNVKKMSLYSSARNEYNLKNSNSIFLDANESPFKWTF